MTQVATNPTIGFIEETYGTERVRFVGTTANRASYFVYPDLMETGSAHLDHPNFPQIKIDASFGGRDDAFVVSDDYLDKNDFEVLRSRQNAIHSFFSRSLPERLLTEGVVLARERRNEIADEYSFKFSNLLSAVKTWASTGSNYPAIASMALINASKASALYDGTKYNALRTASTKHTMMSVFSAFLGPVFAESGFRGSEPYEDGLGALVIDYIRSADRVTFALDENAAELFYFEAGEFHSALYEDPSASLSDIIEFVRQKFA